MTATVRRLGPDDWETWRDVRLAALADAPRAFGSSLEREQTYTDADWRARLEPSRGLKATAVDVGAVGVVGVWMPEDRPAELFGMWVHPSHRGRGVGDLLITEALAWTRSAGLSRLDLWVVGDNAAAQKLYLRNGFTMTGESQPYPRDPSLLEYVMSHDLTAADAPAAR
ncbi:GNAT family N-acetyltransferase [Dactylosporangium sp. CA-233914]|uniref:GNAT family N-acetyltransferase n=1 Tax=Dactylosporangium sp. CA-233914 TaxID=3239934 RepID=UPI003D92D8B6